MEEKVNQREEDKKKGAIPRKPLQDLIKERRQAAKKAKDEKFKMEGPVVDDPYKRTHDLKTVFRKPTAYGYIPSNEHASPYDRNHPECPRRCTQIHDALADTLLARMRIIQKDHLISIDDDDLLGYAHSPDYIATIRSLCISSDLDECQMYDSIFYDTESSFWCAANAARMAVTMAKLVAEGVYHNGFANIRPPGHHATSEEPGGYCLFNNVAITANYLLQQKLAERVLIVDYDVHHGQGTQQMFYHDRRVMYFSIHRYEYGTFWPNLQESNYDYIGDGDGIGYNINVPLNETGINDYDYLAIIINVLLPLAYEFNPSIVLVSGGYDACMGDPEGRMNLTPAFYGHCISLLGGLANGKTVVLLEGGYFIPSLRDAAVRTCQALLNDPCHKMEYSRHINPSVIASINDVKNALRPHWRCFYQMDHLINIGDLNRYDKYGLNVEVKKYIGTPDKPPYPVVACWPVNTKKQDAMYIAQLAFIKEERYGNAQTKVGFIINHNSINHNPPADQRAQEVHMRIVDVLLKIKEYSLDSRMIQIEFDYAREHVPRPTVWEQIWEAIVTTHSSSYLHELASAKKHPRPDLYWTDRSRETAQWSVAILIQLAKKIKRGIIRHGVGVIRPPGHHAKYADGSGFCLINNVVVTANYLIRKEGFKKVLIVDFDVHHGDGTQELTYNRDDIMYISMHRFDDGKFFPKDKAGNFTYVGEDKGVGYNLNIPFNQEKMDSADYLHTWIKIVLPISYAYNPDIILVSAGFDASVNDPLGHYNVYPEVYGHFIQLLKSVGPCIIALEGGYHRESTSLGMVNCCRALLGQPLPPPVLADVKDTTLETVTNVITVAKQYWPILEVNKWVSTRGPKKYDPEEMLKSVKALSINN